MRSCSPKKPSFLESALINKCCLRSKNNYLFK